MRRIFLLPILVLTFISVAAQSPYSEAKENHYKGKRRGKGFYIDKAGDKHYGKLKLKPMRVDEDYKVEAAVLIYIGNDKELYLTYNDVTEFNISGHRYFTYDNYEKYEPSMSINPVFEKVFLYKYLEGRISVYTHLIFGPFKLKISSGVLIKGGKVQAYTDFNEENDFYFEFIKDNKILYKKWNKWINNFSDLDFKSMFIEYNEEYRESNL